MGRFFVVRKAKQDLQDLQDFQDLEGESRYRQRRYRVTQGMLVVSTGLSVRFAPGRKVFFYIFDTFCSELCWVEPAHERHLIRDVKFFVVREAFGMSFGHSLCVTRKRRCRFLHFSVQLLVKGAIVLVPRQVLRRVAFSLIKREIQHQLCLADCLAHRST